MKTTAALLLLVPLVLTCSTTDQIVRRLPEDQELHHSGRRGGQISRDASAN